MIRHAQSEKLLSASELAKLQRITRLSDLMDRSIKLPGGMKIGWDGIIGLIPGFGDIFGLAVSSYILIIAMQLGATKSTLIRMMGNIGIEALVGTIPFLGDLFDFLFKANSRNLDLLSRDLSVTPMTNTSTSDKSIIVVLCLVFLVVVIVSLYLITFFVSLLYKALF